MKENGMTTGFFQFFNNKAQRAKGRADSEKKSRGGRERFALKPRRLLTEALEERQLLAVDVLGSSYAPLATESANVINITSSDYSIDAIKEAIHAAAQTPEDEIIRVPAGVLQFSSASDTIEIDYDASAYGSITIAAVGGDLRFDACGYGRVFTIKSGSVSLESIEIVGGLSDYGGAIANGGTLSLKDVLLYSNSATVSGGAIANKGVLTIQDSKITHNTATSDGAAIYEGDFAWPAVVAPEWTSQIPDQVGGKGQTLNITLPDYCSDGDWTYAFTCSNSNADIFAAEPTIVNGVLTLQFIGEDDYDAGSDFSPVDFTVTASDGTTTVSQTFKASHACQTGITIAAVISNMTLDDVDAEYGEYFRKKLIGFCASDIPTQDANTDLTSDDLYIQVWSNDRCYDDGESELVWNAGDFVTTGYVIVLQLTNARVVESYLPATFCRSGDRITTEDCGNGKYVIYPAYTSGGPFGYNDALLLDMLRIQAIDPSKPVSVELAQYSTDPTLPSAVRMYGSTPVKVDPSQILYQGCISNSTEPYASHPGDPIVYSSSAVVEGTSVVNVMNYSTTISNSLIVNNTATGNGVVYVASEGEAAIYNTTIANNEIGGAAVYALGSTFVGNSIIVNGTVAPVTSSVSGSNNLVNATITSSVTYEADKPLFVEDGYQLAPGSQASNIGVADNALDVSGSPLVSDLGGSNRVSGSSVDAGAYEYQGVAPNAPINATVSDYVDSSKNPTLSWTAPESVDGIKGYYVYFAGNEAPIATTTDTSLANLANLVTLVDNSTYAFSIVAFNDYGVSDAASVTLDTTVAPVAPSNVQFGAYSANSSRLTWNTVSNAASYTVSLKNETTGVVATYTTTTNSYTFTDLVDFSVYSCTVTAVNARGSATSEAATLNTTVTPAIPTGLVASPYAGDGTTTLTWNAVDHAEGYKIARREGSSWVIVASVSSTSYRIEGLADNGSYTYAVAAYAINGDSELVSDYASVTFSTVVAPLAPANLAWVGSYESNSATLQWTPSSGAVGYQVSVNVDGEWVVVGTTTNPNYTFTGLIDNREYVYGVSAYSERDSEKLYSDVVSIDLNTVVAPASATGARFLPYSGGSSAVLTWTAPVGGATGYTIQEKQDDSWVEVAVVDTVGYTVEVSENSYYSYRVVAFNQVGKEIRYADASEAANLDTLVPPQGEIAVSVGSYNYATGDAQLTWTNIPYASSYTIEMKAAGQEYAVVASNVAAGEGTVVTHNLSGLSQHTTYQFRVTAANAKGQGSSAESEPFYTAAPPLAPEATYVYNSTTGSATLSFTAMYATSYVVTDSDGEVVYEGTEGSCVISDLDENQTYVYTVTAKNDVGSSPSTNLSVFTAAVPQAPTGLAFGEYASNSATLTWNNVEAESGYNVYLLVDGEWVLYQTTSADVTTITMTDLSDYSVYTLSVSAFNDIGESTKSASATLDTTIAPDAPTGLAWSFGESESYQGDGNATFVWTAVEHAAGYRVQIYADGTWQTYANVTTNSCNITGLANYSTYSFRVASYAIKGTVSLYSENAFAELSTDWIPTGELVLSVGDYDADSKTSVLSWNEVQAAESYRVEQLVGNDWILVGATEGGRYELSLADNTNYVFRVVAMNSIGDGSSAQIEFFTAAAPLAPTVSGVYDSSTGSATIRWNADFATSYTLADAEGRILYQGSATSFVVTDLAENTSYSYTVVAGNEQGNSPATSYTLYTAAVPAAPTGLVFGEYADNSVTLSWNAVDAANGYRIYMISATGQLIQIGATSADQTNVRLTELIDYSLYSYCVSAFNSEGESAYSEVAVLDTTVTPNPPTNVRVVYGESETYQGDGNATIVWDAVEHAEGYTISKKVDGSWVVVGSTTTTSYAISELENFNVYEYAVSATATRYQETLESERVVVTIDTTWIPTGEISLSVGDYNYADGSIVLSWNAVENASGYRLEQLVDSAWVTVGTYVELSYTAILSGNTGYDFRVVAYNAVGDGSSASASFFTFAPPAAPSDAAFGEFVAETGKATMTWSVVPYAQWYEVGVYVDGVMSVVKRDVPNFTAEGLVEDMEYVYYVRACNFIGDSSVEGYSDWVEVTLDTHPSTAPLAPSEFGVVNYSEATKTGSLVWKDNSRNEEYFLIESSLDGRTWSAYSKVDANATSLTNVSLQLGSTYFFRIAAVNVYGQSEWVETQYTTPTGIPAAPSDVVFSDYDQNAQKFTMSWTNNADNALYFTVSYSLNGVWYDSRDVKADTTSYDWEGLTEGQTYQFRVCAWNMNGVSEYAYGTYEVPYHGATRPAAPSDITFGEFNASDKSVKISWTDNSDNEISFAIQFSFDGDTWRSAGSTDANVSERIAVGMIPDREYYFRVAAYNAAGYSDWAYGQFVAESTLAAPTDFVFGDYVNGTLQTSWTYSETLDESAGFIVQSSIDGLTWSRVGVVASDTTECLAKNVAPGRTYYFRVAAYSGSLTSDWLYSEAYKTASSVPTAPTGLTFSDNSNNSVKLSWTDTTSLEVGFNVQYSVDGGVTWNSAGNTSTNVTTKTVSSLRDGASYLFRVRAYNYYGSSEWTTGEFRTSQSENAPNAPADVKLSNYDAISKTIEVSWTDNASNEAGFTVQYSYDGGATWYVDASCAANTQHRTTTGLVAGRSYQFRVCAFNDDGASDWAYSEVFLVEASAKVPASPTNLTATLDGFNATLAWTDVASDESGYKVECKAGSGAWTAIATLDANANSYIATNLDGGVKYAFRVYAFNSFGSSAYSNESSVDVLADGIAVPTFESFVYSSTRRSIAIGWSAVADATYKVQYSLDQTNWYGLASNGTSATLSGASYGKTYYFRVKAITTDDGSSEWTTGWYNTQTGESSLSTLRKSEPTSDMLLDSLFSSSVDQLFDDEFYF